MLLLLTLAFAMPSAGEASGSAVGSDEPNLPPSIFCSADGSPADRDDLLVERDDLVARLPRLELEKAAWGRLDASAKFFLIEPNGSACHPRSGLKSGQYGLPDVLLPRLRASPLRTLDPGEARVAYLAFPAWVFVGAQVTSTCDACSEALSTALRESQWHGERMFLSIGVPAPRFASELLSSHLACRQVWGTWRTLVKPANAHVLSIEGFTPSPNRTHCASGCQWEQTYRGHRFEDDWRQSVPYPNSWSPSLVAARTSHEVTAHQKRLRQAARPGLLGWLFGPGHQDEVERLKAGERTTLREKIRDTLPAHRLESPHEYWGVRYCLMPAGTTPSRGAFFQAMGAGCVPVVFSPSFECPFYDMAYQLNLPMRRARSGWGAGEYSVIIDSVLAERDAHHVLAVLEGIDERTYLKMRDRVVDLLPRITYFHVAVPGVSDAVDAILEALLSFSKP